MDVKPLFPRIGGKSRLSNWIINQLKERDFSIFVDAFCGTGAIYLKVLEEQRKDLTIVLNDKDSDIFNLYEVCRDYPELLAQLINFTPYSRQEFNLSKIETNNKIEQARRFLIRTNQSFSGGEKTWGYVRKDRNRLGKWAKLPDKILAISSELKRVYLENDDFEKVCQRFDSPQTLHYLDPPYFDKEYYYNEIFTEEDHIRLCKMAHQLEGQVVISYYPHDEIMKMYCEDKWKYNLIETVASSKGITRGNREKRPRRTELLLIRKSKSGVIPVFNSNKYKQLKLF